MNYQFICIEGCIGAGKSSLAKLLSEDMNARLILEEFEDNPFLPKFYKEPEKYAFQLELSFLAERYQQLKDKLHTPDIFHPQTISDYIINKSLIFAKNNLVKDEFSLYQKLFGIVDNSIPKPDLLVYLYLNAEQLKANIQKRGRDYEQEIEYDYLEKIQDGYFDYLKQIQDFPVLVINTNTLDFVKNKEDYQELKDLIFSPHKKGFNIIELDS
jgi:deoxyadenosine/deoxycytidine kinase